jgi:hypothetical protein
MSEITTQVLEWFPDESGAHGSIVQQIMDFQQRWNVTMTIENNNAPGGIPIRLSGACFYVRHCVREVWARDWIENEYGRRWGPEIEKYIRRVAPLPGDKHDHDKLHWSAHWAATDESTEDVREDARELAIQMLSNAGYNLNQEMFSEEKVTMAQTYLELAFRHCPNLMNEVAPLVTVNDYKPRHKKEN